jgi:hypothetical protein
MNKATRNPTNGPQDADQDPPRASVGESEVAARKGVLSALRPNSQTGDGRYPIAWLSISAPRGATPTASSTCLCGWDRRVFGARKVLALIADHAGHRDVCPLRAPLEGRTAA